MIFEKVARLVAEQFGVDEASITPETSFEDNLNADSLDIVELTMAIEEEFDLGEMEEESLDSPRTVGDLCDFIASRTLD